MSIKRLTILADQFEKKIASQDGEYGGKGEFELPATHKAAMQVTKGGSSCKNCRFVDAENHACKNKYYIKWNGGDNKLPDLPLDEICSDWWEPR
jgi:hypothetical protein